MRQLLSNAQAETTDAVERTLITQMYMSDPERQSPVQAVDAVERALDQHQQVLAQLEEYTDG